MPRDRIKNCRACGRHIDEVGPLSRRFKCEPCSTAAVNTAARQMMSGSGEYFDRYAAGLTRAAERARARANPDT